MSKVHNISGMGTDDIVEEYRSSGLSRREAFELAMEHISSKSFKYSTEEFKDIFEKAVIEGKSVEDIIAEIEKSMTEEPDSGSIEVLPKKSDIEIAYDKYLSNPEREKKSNKSDYKLSDFEEAYPAVENKIKSSKWSIGKGGNTKTVNKVVLKYVTAIREQESKSRVPDLETLWGKYESSFKKGQEPKYGKDVFTKVYPVIKEKIDSGSWGRAGRRTGAEYDLYEFIGKHAHGKIGALFKGEKMIKEVETDSFYIPSSYNCVYKCLAKFVKPEKYDIEIKNVNPYGISSKRYYEFCRNNLGDNEFPSLLGIRRRGTEGLEAYVKLDIAFNKVGCAILMFPVGKCEFHAILLKKGTLREINEPGYLESVIGSIQFATELNLTADNQKLAAPQFKAKIARQFYVYDIETSSNVNERGERVQVPEGIAYCKVDMDAPENIKIKSFIGHRCFIDFLTRLAQENAPCSLTYVYAHNGGGFDNIFVKGIPGVKILSQIAGGTKMKELCVEYEGRHFSFRDTQAFMLLSLKALPKCFGIKTDKMEFDIVNKSAEWFAETREWIPYMERDVEVLAKVCIEFEKSINTLGQSMTTSLGIPGIAYKTLMKTCFVLAEKTYLTRDPVTAKFMRDSLYGGRILHYKKYYNAEKEGSKGLICLDMNSLYPSAMALFEYPTGEYQIIKAKTLEEFIVLLKSCPVIAEVTINNRNNRYPLTPYKSEDGRLLYPAGEFRGVYTSIDILEAIKDGAEVTEFHRGIYWKHAGNIFGDVVTELFERRKKLKAEGNGLEYVYKILLNSMYGKMLELVKTYSYFEDEEPEKGVSFIALKNGQFECREKIKYPISKKPVHIGAFITAYSRKLVNDLIRKVGPENIYYSDTDSIYITLEAYEKAKLEESESLGGFKNDYGKGTIIREAIFLDLKRYFLDIEHNGQKSMKCKFNGINFKDKNALKNFGFVRDVTSPDGKTERDALYDMYKWFLDHPKETMDRKIINDKWFRLKDSVVIVEKELEFQVNATERFIWDGNDAYPFDYDMTDRKRKEYKTHAEDIQKICARFYMTDSPDYYTLGPKNYKCSLPVAYNGEKAYFTSGELNAAYVVLKVPAPSETFTLGEYYVYKAEKKVRKVKEKTKDEEGKEVEKTKEIVDYELYTTSNVWGPITHAFNMTENEFKTYGGMALLAYPAKGDELRIEDKKFIEGSCGLVARARRKPSTTDYKSKHTKAITLGSLK